MNKNTKRRSNKGLPKAGQLWRVKIGLENYNTRSDLTRDDSTLKAGAILMVVANGRWYIQNHTDWLCHDGIYNGFHVSVIYGEKIFDDMRVNTVWWNHWLELVSDCGN